MEIIIPLFSPSHVYIKQKLKLHTTIASVLQKEKVQQKRETEIDFQLSDMHSANPNVNLQYNC